MMSLTQEQVMKHSTTGKEVTAIKQKMKATQKKYLSAAHDQIWGMIHQFKVKGEVSKNNFSKKEY